MQCPVPAIRPGVVRRPGFVNRAMVQADRKTLWVYGDNMERRGLGGQAEEMRGEPNTVGIPVKWAPRRDEDAYFTEADGRHPLVRQEIRDAFDLIREALAEGRDVAIPKKGIGSGRAELPRRAPELFYQLLLTISSLNRSAGLVPTRPKERVPLPEAGTTWKDASGRRYRLEGWVADRESPTALMAALDVRRGRRTSEWRLPFFARLVPEEPTNVPGAAEMLAHAGTTPGIPGLLDDRPG